HFNWDFGDGTSSILAFPKHYYNGTLPMVTCLDIYDTANALACHYCDTVGHFYSNLCDFAILTNTGNTFTECYTTPDTGLISSWDFGDGVIGSGDSTYHTYAL